MTVRDEEYTSCLRCSCMVLIMYQLQHSTMWGRARSRRRPTHPPIARHSLSHRSVRNMIYSVQSYAFRSSQPSANKLSTRPPTANGDNCGNVENFFHTNQRKSVTYPEPGYFITTDHLLTNPPKSADYMACRGWRTPYPQKRQQTLGASITPLWKNAESREFSGFAHGISVKNLELINFQPEA